MRIELIGGIEYEVFAGVEGADYEWESIHALRRIADGDLFEIEQGGCSCYGPFDPDSIAAADIKPLNRNPPLKCPYDNVSDTEWNRYRIAVAEAK